MLWFAALLLLSASLPALAQPGAPFRLRTEYLQDPLGIDVTVPRFSWAVAHGERGQGQSAYRIVVVAATGGLEWDSGKVASSKSVNIEYAGTALLPQTKYVWQVCYWDLNDQQSQYSENASFETAMLAPADWAGAEWIAGGGLIRREFALPVADQIMRARLYIVGMGYYEASLNGAKVGNQLLGTFTTFEVRILYDTYDVTHMLTNGNNALGVWLGAGWYSEPSVHVGDPTLIAQLRVWLKSGSVYTLVTNASDPAWRATASPILFDNIYAGETYDARLYQDGWDQPDFVNGSAWTPVTPPRKQPTGVLSAPMMPPIRATETYTAVDIWSPSPGVFMFDFGQNMAGLCTLRVRGPAGQTISMYHTESINPDGTAHQHEYSNSPQLANYTLRGSDAYEVYTPRFAYFGFRYVQVTGFPGVPDRDTLLAHFVHTDVDLTGQVVFGENELLNAVQHATRYASLSNYENIPTDCPQRERRGWLGDAQLSHLTTIHNFDMAAAYTKFLRDIQDSQTFLKNDGEVPDCVPFYGHGGQPSDPAWGGGYTIIWHSMWQYFEDTRILDQHYDSVKLYLDSLTRQLNPLGLLSFARYGDWCSVGNGFGSGCGWGQAPEGTMSSTFHYILEMEYFAEVANATGRAADASTYLARGQSARQALNQHLYASGRYAGGYQCDQALALALGLPPTPADATLVSGNLLADIASKGNHLDTGIVGTRYLPYVLSTLGRADVALAITTQRDFPSWGFMIEQGATTLWENWQTSRYKAYGSRNHIMFGPQSAWYYQHLAGIQRGGLGWSSLRIAPEPANFSLLSSLSASIDTPQGLVESSWQQTPEGICAVVDEHATAVLQCFGSGVISSIAFASFGTPAGACWNHQLGSCNAANSTAIVANLCLGKSSCSIEASSTLFGDPCFDVPKQLAVEAFGCFPAPTPYVCGQADENTDVVLACASGTITSVDFASFGTPTGSCGSYKAGSCSAANAQAVVARQCINKTSCTISASTAVFGDPCVNTFKRLYVQVSGCSAPPAAPYAHQVTIPANSQGMVVVPLAMLGLQRQALVIAEDGAGTVVWRNNQFVPGTPGVTAGQATAEGVVLTVGAGSYKLRVQLA